MCMSELNWDLINHWNSVHVFDFALYIIVIAVLKMFLVLHTVCIIDTVATFIQDVFVSCSEDCENTQKCFYSVKWSSECIWLYETYLFNKNIAYKVLQVVYVLCLLCQVGQPATKICLGCMYHPKVNNFPCNVGINSAWLFFCPVISIHSCS
jgi:hypothetical protein